MPMQPERRRRPQEHQTRAAANGLKINYPDAHNFERQKRALHRSAGLISVGAISQLTVEDREKMTQPFEDFDLSDFWDDSEFARKEYLDEPLTDSLLSSVQTQLGYKLPSAYVALMRQQNGGMPIRREHRVASPTSWANDHIAITGIFGIGCTKGSLASSMGNQFWIDDWDYPPIGIYFCDCPSAGHDMLCLDYRECGPEGKPRVVHVDEAFDYRITMVAQNFETFVKGLTSEFSSAEHEK
ncbi:MULTISPECIES: SMI1/KNR4 family protein [unclassified Rhizobium]|uniref:SMI1/KNR4 family protein n=1 Tax=unclassified Rhizobium TaxID=2613769 RepID=UPI001FF05F4B|nr:MULTISPECIES: SMI1/KNR4 family protein [unclassified Rhizobium]